MFETDALAQYDNRLFFAQTLERGQEIGRISAEQVGEIHHDIAVLAHKLITIKVEDFSSQAEIRGQIQEAFALTSLGLEYGSQGGLDKSVRLLDKNRLIKLFQIGNTLVDKLAKRAQDTLRKSILISPETPMMRITEREEIPTYNEREREFLDSASERKLVVDAPQVALDRLSSTPRMLASLADITIANRQLDYLNHRLNYLQALPQEKIFDAAYPPTTDSDTPRQITTALMVNLVLYREIDFHLAPEDLNNFRDIAYDAEHRAVGKTARALLIGWIGHYLDLAEQPKAVKIYTIEYWRYCLKQLEMELQREELLEAADVLRP
ncbi:MAG: DUF6178 family protein [Candidatus Poribacteria bacterium]|nr:DUF6178 family protein [Candidatus Poribacteria bacterium]